MTCESRMERFRASDLYVVITESFCAGRTAIEVLDDTLEAGVTLIQLREKDLDSLPLYDRALAFREATREAGALLIINDRLDIAIAVGADGVHLGQHDLPIDVARSIAPKLILGASTHSLEEALAAQAAGADYLNIGPIFPTKTKAVGIEALGPEILDAIVPHLTVPFSCMGGIKKDNIAQLLTRGARHPAVVTAVTAADDIKHAAQELREAILEYA